MVTVPSLRHLEYRLRVEKIALNISVCFERRKEGVHENGLALERAWNMYSFAIVFRGFLLISFQSNAFQGGTKWIKIVTFKISLFIQST